MITGKILVSYKRPAGLGQTAPVIPLLLCIIFIVFPTVTRNWDSMATGMRGILMDTFGRIFALGGNIGSGIFGAALSGSTFIC